MPSGLKYPQLTLIATYEVIRQLGGSNQSDSMHTELAQAKAQAVLDLWRLLVDEMLAANDASAAMHRYDEARMRALITPHLFA